MPANAAGMRFDVYFPTGGTGADPYEKIATVDTDARTVNVHNDKYAGPIKDFFLNPRKVFVAPAQFEGGHIGDVARTLQPWDDQNVNELVQTVLPAWGFKIEMIRPKSG